MASPYRSATVGEHISASSPSLKVSKPFAVFNAGVNMYELTGEPGEGWSKINCVSKKAYGCGDLGKTLVESLRLYVWFGDYPVLTSSLAIRISDEAVRRIEEELGVLRNGKRRPSDWVSGVARLVTADARLINIILAFHNQRCDYLGNGYNLVYDAIDSSLTLINYLPDGHHPRGARTAVLNRIGDRGGDYNLVLLTRCITDDKDLLCICTPDSRAKASANGMGPWKVMGRRFPKQVQGPFYAELGFTFQGKAFWADFMRGCLLYCDLRSCLSHAEFIAISLPSKCLVDPENAPEDDRWMKVIRTMGCVGDSIWLVCIHRSKTSAADDSLMVWTLDLAKKRWKQEVQISAKSLWELDSFKQAGLPKTALKYPVLTTNGALCLVLPEQHYSEFGPNQDRICFGPNQDRICCFDVNGWNLLWHGYVHNYDANSPAILPSNFFERAASQARADTGRF